MNEVLKRNEARRIAASIDRLPEPVDRPELTGLKQHSCLLLKTHTEDCAVFAQNTTRERSRMPRTIGVMISSLAVLGFVSIAAAAPVASIIATQVSAREVVVPVAFKCEMVEGKLVCGKTGGNKNRDDDDDDDDDDKPKKSKDKVIPKTCGKKVNCEVGYVKLSKPNAHGACCEARDAPAKAEKCKFPGQINPPNCDCPQGTEFMGYKGCMPKLDNWSCKATAPSGYTYLSYRAASEGDAVTQFIQETKRRNFVVTGPITCERK